VRTVVRFDVGRPYVELIPQHDIEEDDAHALVAAGVAEWGPEYELPPVVYLVEDLLLGGVYYPTGATLHVGPEVTEGKALALIRAGVASVPMGGVG
jgi:hypothetical protein